MVKGILRGEVRRRQVVIAGADHHLEVGVLGEGGAKRVGGAGVPLRVAPVPGHDAAAHVVGHVGLVLEVRLEVAEEAGLERGADQRAAGVEFGELAGVARGGSGESSIVAADREPLLAEELARELADPEPHLALINVAFFQAREAGELFDDVRPFFSRELVPLVERVQVRTHCEPLGLAEDGLEVLAL